MKNSEIKAFQRKPRRDQLRELLEYRIRQGYSVDDFQRDYYTSEQDRKEFLQLQAELLRK